MFLRIKNWKLALLSIVMIALLMKLGFWQLSRAREKTAMLAMFDARTKAAPLTAADLKAWIATTATQSRNDDGVQTQAAAHDDHTKSVIASSRSERGNPADLRYSRVTLKGHFDNKHTLLLDNKIYMGKVGYEVFTPFNATGLSQPILVDRGFIAAESERSKLPTVRSENGLKTITGILNHPPGYVKLGEMNTETTVQWPLRIEYMNMTELERLYQTTFFPYVINLDPKDPSAYPIEWQIVGMSPERHLGYAVQWFALALTLLILSIASNRTK